MDSRAGKCNYMIFQSETWSELAKASSDWIKEYDVDIKVIDMSYKAFDVNELQVTDLSKDISVWTCYIFYNNRVLA
jgi:hypothetical protein